MNHTRVALQQYLSDAVFVVGVVFQEVLVFYSAGQHVTLRIGGKGIYTYEPGRCPKFVRRIPPHERYGGRRVEWKAESDWRYEI